MKTKILILLAVLAAVPASARTILPPGEVREPDIVDHYFPPRRPVPVYWWAWWWMPMVFAAK